ncbi:MAG: hypothetical protein ACI9FR_002833 [Cryomorphaceae bacterium]|jgi:hypothetical protein
MYSRYHKVTLLITAPIESLTQGKQIQLKQNDDIQTLKR